jgi:uncharacterized protein
MEIKRTVIEEIEKWLGREKILILKGARQTGKTTILKYLQQQLERRDEVTAYYSIDMELSSPFFSEPKLLIKFIKEQYSGEFLYLFLDEFQYIDNAGLFLKVVFDAVKEYCQIIVSGSSSLEITKNSEFLTGRKIDFHINTISYREFISYRSDYSFNHSFNIENVAEITDFDVMYGAELRRCMLEYLSFGGYPEIVTTVNEIDKVFLLKELLTTYIQKDVAGFLRVSNITGFNNLLRLLVAQTGNLVNKNELASSLRLGHDTIVKYCDILSGTYLINFITPFFKNIRKELSKMPKVYVADFGLINIFSTTDYFNDYNLIPGSLIENFVFGELVDRKDCNALHYYRTVSKSEIDFIMLSDNVITPIEVKFSGKIKSLPVAMKNFNKHYGDDVSKNIIITRDYIGYDSEQNCYFIPVYILPFLK